MDDDEQVPGDDTTAGGTATEAVNLTATEAPPTEPNVAAEERVGTEDETSVGADDEEIPPASSAESESPDGGPAGDGESDDDGGTGAIRIGDGGDEDAVSDDDVQKRETNGRRTLGSVIIALGLLTIVSLVLLWPSYLESAEIIEERAAATAAATATASAAGEGDAASEATADEAETVDHVDVDLPRRTAHLPIEQVILITMLLIGAAGATIHAFTSFGSYSGNRTFTMSWGWWYLVRLPIGALLGALIYLAIRGGLATLGTADDAFNPFAVAVLAALAGTFSKQAVDKLEEIFNTFFKASGGDSQRSDKLDGLKVDTVSPAALDVGVGAVEVTLTGSGLAEAKVTAGSRTVEPTEQTATEVRFELEAGEVEDPGRVNLVIASGSEQLTKAVRVRPVIDTLDWDQSVAQLVVRGRGFAPDARVRVGRRTRSASRSESGDVVELRVTLKERPSTKTVVVMNGSGHGGKSAEFKLAD